MTTSRQSGWRIMLALPVFITAAALVPHGRALSEPAGERAQTVAAASCSPRISFLARGYGEPDDVALRNGHVLFGDLRTGVVAELLGHHKKVLVSRLNVPEGIAVAGRETLIVVEQGLNRLDQINLRTHRRRVLLSFRNTTGNEGVDAISRVHGDLIIPNSPYGTLLRLHRGRLTRIISGLSRPTDAIPYDGGFAVADENANAVWLVKRGHMTRLATIPTPDDVAVVGKLLLAVALGDGSLWEVRPHVLRLSSRFSQPQGLASLGSHSAVVADSAQNAIYRVTFSKACTG